MLNIALIAIAIALLFIKRISLSENLELRRPRTFYFSIIIVIAVIISEYFNRNIIAKNDAGSPIFILLPVLAPLIAIFILKQKKEIVAVTGDVSVPQPPDAAKKTVNIIGWIFLTILLVSAIINVYNMYAATH